MRDEFQAALSELEKAAYELGRLEERNARMPTMGSDPKPLALRVGDARIRLRIAYARRATGEERGAG